MKSQIKESKDFRKLIIEGFNASGAKLDLMESYAKHHANMELKIGMVTLSDEKTTLPLALSVMNELKLDNKQVQFIVTVPMTRFTIELERDWKEKYSEEQLERMMVKHIAEQINAQVEEAAKIRINRIVCDLVVMQEGKHKPQLVAHSQYKIIEWP